MLDTAAWIAKMKGPAAALRVPRHGPVNDTGLDEHAAAATTDLGLYALMTIVDGASAEQQVRALYALLAASRKDASAEARELAERVIAYLSARLPADDVIATFLALRRRRVNHKHASRALARWVLRHPRGEALLASRRAALRDVIEHALGRDVLRGCEKHLATRSADGDAYLARTLHKLVGGDRDLTETRVAQLGRGAAAPATALEPIDLRTASGGAARPTFVGLAIADAETAPADGLPKTVTATNRGDVAATLVHIYQGGASTLLSRGLADYIDRAASRLPFFDGSIALVVDASASTLGYGERKYCCISQSWALRLVLEKRCAKLSVHVAGGRSDPPEPDGATDLVMPLFDALATGPDVVAIVTDGYENRLAGELARVIAALPRAGITTPVVIVNSKFTHKDDLTLRVPAPDALAIDMWHEHDFGAVLAMLGGTARGLVGRAFLHHTLSDRLTLLEKTRPPWLRPSPH